MEIGTSRTPEANSAWPTQRINAGSVVTDNSPLQSKSSVNSPLKIAVITHFLSNPYLSPGRQDKYQSTWSIILLSLEQALSLGNRTLCSIHIFSFTLLICISLCITTNHLSHLKNQKQTKNYNQRKTSNAFRLFSFSIPFLFSFSVITFHFEDPQF